MGYFHSLKRKVFPANLCLMAAAAKIALLTLLASLSEETIFYQLTNRRRGKRMTKLDGTEERVMLEFKIRLPIKRASVSSLFIQCSRLSFITAPKHNTLVLERASAKKQVNIAFIFRNSRYLELGARNGLISDLLPLQHFLWHYYVMYRRQQAQGGRGRGGEGSTWDYVWGGSYG